MSYSIGYGPKVEMKVPIVRVTALTTAKRTTILGSRHASSTSRSAAVRYSCTTLAMSDKGMPAEAEVRIRPYRESGGSASKH